MRRFSNLNSYELTEVQYIIQDIYHLKRKIIIYQIYTKKK